MNGSRVAAIVLRQLYLYRGSPARILPIFAWVAVDIVLWGFITRYLNSVALSGCDFVPALLGAVLLWDFLTRVMQGVTMAFFEDVWSRNFLNFFATPLRTSEYLSGLVITGVGTSLVGLAVMVAVAWAVFGLSSPELRRGAGAVRDGAVRHRHCLRNHRRLSGAAARPGLGVADLADPDAGLAVRRRLLSGVDPAGLDAGGRPHIAAVVRLRRHAGGDRRHAGAVGAGWRWRAASPSSTSPVPACCSPRSTGPRSAPG